MCIRFVVFFSRGKLGSEWPLLLQVGLTYNLHKIIENYLLLFFCLIFFFGFLLGRFGFKIVKRLKDVIVYLKISRMTRDWSQFSVKYGCAIACSALIRIFGTQTSNFCRRSRPLEFNRGTT